MTPPLRKIIEYARLAPSVHNTQPWSFHISESSITLSAENSRALEAGDPTGRELWVSLGVCLEATLQAAKGLGFTPSLKRLQTEKTTEPFAMIQLEFTGNPHPEILTLLKERYSHRAKMHTTKIPPSLLEECAKLLTDLPNVSLILVQDRETIEKVADITNKGMQLALSNAKFRKELTPLLHYNWSTAEAGLHGYVLNHGLLGSIWEKWSVALGLDSKRKASADEQKVLESSGLLFIVSKGDVPNFWLEVGQAYMRVVLEITRQGFAHSTLTAPIEAARFHEDIEAMLGTPYRIQSMIRIGKAAHPLMRHSPRLSVDELLT